MHHRHPRFSAFSIWVTQAPLQVLSDVEASVRLDGDSEQLCGSFEPEYAHLEVCSGYSVTGLEHIPTAGQVGSFVTAVSTMRLPTGNVRPLLHATSVSKVTFQYAKAIHLPGIRGCYTRISKRCRRASRLQLGRYSGFDEPHPANYMIP